MSASFDYYRTFYYVAKYKNFTRAATMLLSSQPSVTRSIQNLESELGCRLFIRSRHGVTLPPEGEMLYRYVAPACERILRGEEELGLSLGLHGGAVSVGATETALHCLLLDRLALFQKEHPDKAGGLRKFLNYYLPTTLKILNSYAELEKQGVEGENIAATKKRIENMMDMVVEGFERQLDKLFAGDMMDIAADITVMEQMMQGDGLFDGDDGDMGLGGH